MTSTWNFMHIVLVLLLASCTQAAEDQPPILPDRRQYIGYYVTDITPSAFRTMERIKAPCKLNEAKVDLSLWRHAYSDKFSSYNLATCPYVFLVASAQQALVSAKSIINRSYIYSVHLDERSIDVRATFDPYYERFEDRWAILGDLLFRQVESWRYVEHGQYSNLVFNQDFDWQTYQRTKAYGAAPQFAGFPKTHLALSKQPWNQTICLFDSVTSEPPEQETCRPDTPYTTEFQELPLGILARLRDNQMQPRDCPHLLSFLNFYLPGLKSRTEKFTGKLLYLFHAIFVSYQVIRC
ncbi:putative enterotoxin [Ophiocordyceps australis]|uniref:Putative enterotoxin n=1 Tax=Ophiocordyceps australis TaxID=1399860 RepID=A0A2C5ZNM3_9HYPO|nr:putative enterotoxin [Ophiocordyceps australis]